MRMAEEAFRELWPEKESNYDFSIKYSGRFRGYNANVKLCGRNMVFSLSKSWRGISRDIKTGLLQELMAKVCGDRKTTANIDLYHIFLKKVHIAVPKTKTEPMLEQSFDRVNSRFFFGMIEKPNFVWNSSSIKLGSYDYGSDTITISRMLEDADAEMIDYVMHHEMLHKKHKFTSKGGKLCHHTRDFKSSERAFPNSGIIERRLKTLRPCAAMRIGKPKKKRFSLFGIKF